MRQRRKPPPPQGEGEEGREAATAAAVVVAAAAAVVEDEDEDEDEEDELALTELRSRRSVGRDEEEANSALEVGCLVLFCVAGLFYFALLVLVRFAFMLLLSLCLAHA
jgi:hypothetical protein